MNDKTNNLFLIVATQHIYLYTKTKNLKIQSQIAPSPQISNLWNPSQTPHPPPPKPTP